MHISCNHVCVKKKKISMKEPLTNVCLHLSEYMLEYYVNNNLRTML